MTEILIRDVPEPVIAAIDVRAAELGTTRAEFVRLQILREASRLCQLVTLDDLKRSGTLFAGLLDDELMERAWSRPAG